MSEATSLFCHSTEKLNLNELSAVRSFDLINGFDCSSDGCSLDVLKCLFDCSVMLAVSNVCAG